MNTEYFGNDIAIKPMKMQVNKSLHLEKGKKNKLQTNIFKRILSAIPPLIFMFFAVYFVNNFISAEPVNLNHENSDIVIADNDEVLNSIGSLTKVPRVVEKSVFERLLKNIPKSEKRILYKMDVYYSLFALEQGKFYILDQNATTRETNKILDYWNKYMHWDDVSYFYMMSIYRIQENDFISSDKDTQSHSHVRFSSMTDW